MRNAQISETYHESLDALFAPEFDDSLGAFDSWDEESSHTASLHDSAGDSDDENYGILESFVARDPEWETFKDAGFTEHDVIRIAIPQIQDFSDGQVDRVVQDIVADMSDAEAAEFFKSLGKYASKAMRLGAKVVKPLATVAGGAIGAKFGGVKGAQMGAKVGNLFGGIASSGMAHAAKSARPSSRKVHRRNTHNNATRIRRRTQRKAHLGNIARDLTRLSQRVRHLQSTESRTPPGYESDTGYAADLIAEAAHELAAMDDSAMDSPGALFDGMESDQAENGFENWADAWDNPNWAAHA